jgi:predicted transcriptional regulator
MVKAKPPEAVTTIRLERSIMVALDKAADAEDRSRSWLIQQILVEGLKARAKDKSYEKHIANMRTLPKGARAPKVAK